MRARPGESAWSLVIFTVLVQASVGVAFVSAFSPRARLSRTALILLVVGSVAAVFHLGRIRSVRFALSNLRSSWLSREGLLAGAFGLALLASVTWPGVRAAGFVAAAIGVVLVGAISMVYMIRTIPAWHTWATPATFYLTAVVLGASIPSAPTEGGPALLPIAAVAAAAQLVPSYVRFARSEARRIPPGFGLCGALTVLGILAVCLGPTGGHIAAVAFLGSELAGRYAFYASHRRIGL